MRVRALSCLTITVGLGLLVTGCGESTTGAAGGGGNAETVGEGGSGGLLADVDTLCRTWCRNEEGGPNCCQLNCRDDCFDDCVAEATTGTCVAEWTAATECWVAFECDDFFGDCAETASALGRCTLDARAGVCTDPPNDTVLAQLTYIDDDGILRPGLDAVEAIASDCVFGAPPRCGAEAGTVLGNSSPENRAALANCVTACTSMLAPLTPDCLVCHGERMSCRTGFCPGQCAASTEAPGCLGCQEQAGCLSDFQRCSGLVGTAIEGCETVSVRCQTTKSQCTDVFDDDDTACVSRWNNYVSCVDDQSLTCARCADLFINPPGQCSWPEGAAMDDWGGNPPACLDLPTEPFGCGQRCPGGSDSSCSTGTFCSNEVCDAECFDTGDCDEDLQCDPRGRCSVPPPQCGDGNMLDSTHPTAERVLECDVMGIAIALPVVFTANPQGVLTPTQNTFDLQMELVIPVNTVNLLLNLTTMIKVLSIEGTVVPTVGTSDTNTVALSAAPVPCDVFLESDEAVSAAVPPGQGTWGLDQGVTQELSLENLAIEVDAAGIGLVLSTEGNDPACAWADSNPPSLQFGLP